MLAPVPPPALLVLLVLLLVVLLLPVLLQPAARRPTAKSDAIPRRSSIGAP
jgi:hypothetical protein